MRPAVNDKIYRTEVLNLVKDYFNGDEKKVALWFGAKNPLLGGVTPLYMIKVGREQKLHSFVKSCIEGNYI